MIPAAMAGAGLFTGGGAAAAGAAAGAGAAGAAGGFSLKSIMGSPIAQQLGGAAVSGLAGGIEGGVANRIGGMIGGEYTPYAARQSQAYASQMADIARTSGNDAALKAAAAERSFRMAELGIRLQHDRDMQILRTDEQIRLFNAQQEYLSRPGSLKKTLDKTAKWFTDDWDVPPPRNSTIRGWDVNMPSYVPGMVQ